MTESVYFLELVVLSAVSLLCLSLALLLHPRGVCIGEDCAPRGSGGLRWRLSQRSKTIVFVLWGSYASLLLFLLVDTDLAAHWRSVYAAWAVADPSPAEVEATAEETVRWTGWWVVFAAIAAIPLASTFVAYQRMGISVRWKPRRFALMVTSGNILAGYLSLILLLALFWPSVLSSWAAALNIAWEPSRELFPGT